MLPRPVVQFCSAPLVHFPSALDTSAYNNGGVAYGNLGQYDRAIQDYDEASRLNPQEATTYGNRGFAYMRLGQYESAIQDYDKAIQNRGNTYLYSQEANYVNRGLAYHSLGQYESAIQDYDEAIRLYDRAIRLDPQAAIAYHNRGLAYERLGKTKEAALDYRKAKERGYRP